MTDQLHILPTLNQIRKAHGWKRDYEKYLPISRFVFRPVDFLLTWAAIRMGLTTEGVAWLSGIVGIAGCLCLVSGYENMLPVGIGLLLFFNLLDCVDGSIARTMKTENPYGRFLDSICGGIIDLTFWSVIGIMAFRHPDLLIWSEPFGYGPLFWLAMGCVTCFLSILVGFFENTFDMSLRQDWDNIQIAKHDVTRSLPEMEKTKPHLNNNSVNMRMYMLRMINTNIRVRESHYILLVFAYLTQMIDLLLVVYLLYYSFFNILLLVAYIKRGRIIRRLY